MYHSTPSQSRNWRFTFDWSNVSRNAFSSDIISCNRSRVSFMSRAVYHVITLAHSRLAMMRTPATRSPTDLADGIALFMCVNLIYYMPPGQSHGL